MDPSEIVKVLLKEESDEEIEDNFGFPATNSCESSESELDAKDHLQELHYVGKDGFTVWQKTREVKNMEKFENLETFGAKMTAKDKSTPLECFELFFTAEMLETIAKCTNEKIRVIEARDAAAKNETNSAEIKALLGLLFITGLIRTNRQNSLDLWSTDGTGMDLFRDTMSRNRFYFLLNNLRFDSVVLRSERLKVDVLAPIRQLFEQFVKNCHEVYSPYENLCLGKIFVSFRGKCDFRAHLAEKKSGIKMFCLVDCKTGFTLNMEIYCPIQPENSPYSLSYKPDSLIERMLEFVPKHRNVTLDRFQASLETAQNLLHNHKISIVGVLSNKSACIPPIFTRTFDSRAIFGHSGSLTLMSCAARQPKRRLVILASHQGIENPELAQFYYRTKQGVEAVEKLCRSYDLARNSKNWPLSVFFAVLNHAALNSMVIHMLNSAQNDTKLNSRAKFIRELGLELTREHLATRRLNQRLPREIRARIGRYLEKTKETEELAKTVERKGVKRANAMHRCAKCPRKRDRKTKRNCKKCLAPICIEHAEFVCEDCLADTCSASYDLD